MSIPSIPIADLHCDLLSYLARVPGADWNNRDDIGVALPHLKKGGVQLQVMAIYTATKAGSVAYANLQAEKWKQILAYEGVVPVSSVQQMSALETGKGIGVLAAIENASGLCEEGEDLKIAWDRLEYFQREVGPLLYISFTHHDENRFGGGNYSDNIGLKADGMALLERLSGQKIAVDLAHASDRLAEDIFSYVDKHKLVIPILASHSNFRQVWNHVRNLPDELAQELLQKGGLMGMNFLRAYVDDDSPDRLYEHIAHGWELGAEKQLAFGADFFYGKDFHDPQRLPLFHPQLENASVYPEILDRLLSQKQDLESLKNIAWNNVKFFLQALWG